MNKYEQVCSNDHQLSLAGQEGPRSDVHEVQSIMDNGHMGTPLPWIKLLTDGQT